MSSPINANAAAAHDEAVALDLQMLGLPARNWPATIAGPDGVPMIDEGLAGDAHGLHDPHHVKIRKAAITAPNA